MTKTPNKATITGFLELGIYGLLGLSFNVASASPINAAVHAVYGPEATWGKSVLDNIFEQHPDEPNFIAIDLARTDDLEDTSGGSFGIGEYDSRYLAVKNAPKLAQFPKGGDIRSLIQSKHNVLLPGVNSNHYTAACEAAVVQQVLGFT